MKTFRSKFIALAVTAGLLGIFAGTSSVAKAIDIATCEKWVSAVEIAQFDWSSNNESKQTIIPAAVAEVGCSNFTSPRAWIFSESNPALTYELQAWPEHTSGCKVLKTTDFDLVRCDWSFKIDYEAEKIPDGVYRLIHGGAISETGYVTPVVETKNYCNSCNRFVLDRTPVSTSTSSTTTSPPSPTNWPEVLDDQFTTKVWSKKYTSVFYTTTVRCSPTCGRLPTGFASRLCELGTSFNSSTCISSARPHQIGRAKSTKLGVVNTFTTTFLISKKATDKKYRVYSYIPTGRKQYQILGLDTIVWNGKSSFTNAPSPIGEPTNSVAPGATTTTIAGASPSTTSNVASSAALTVTSDLISGKTSLTVKGNGAAVNIEVSIKCSGQCTKLPNSILGRLCKVGTSYTDASCTSIITLYPIGTTATSSTFRGNTMFGTSPTGADYQPFFSMTATGISGTTRLSGTSRVTWIK